MKKTVVFFIGLPRTGNTTLQEILEKNNLLDIANNERNEFYNYLRGYIFFDDISDTKILEKFDNISFFKQTNLLFIEGLTDPFIPYYRHTVEENILKLINVINKRSELFNFKIVLVERGISWLKSYHNMFGYFLFFKKKSWFFYKNFLIDQKKYFNKLRKEKKIYSNVRTISNYLKKNNIDHNVFNFKNLKSDPQLYTKNLLSEIYDDEINIKNHEHIVRNQYDPNKFNDRKLRFIKKYTTKEKFRIRNIFRYIFLIKIEINIVIYKFLLSIHKKYKKK